MSDEAPFSDSRSLLERIAVALERIVHLMETEPINVKIPDLHPSMTREELFGVRTREDEKT